MATCFHLDNKQAARKLKVTLAGDVLVHDFAPKYLGVTHIQCNTICANYLETTMTYWHEGALS